MYISADYWDAKSAQVDLQSIQIPDQGWIIQPSVSGRRFALKAGSSVWKINAPTIEIAMKEAREITGRKSESLNPDDDNLSLWAAADRVLPAVISSCHQQVNAEHGCNSTTKCAERDMLFMQIN
jgi:hypothetical protein